jgi:hypothetical protein
LESNVDDISQALRMVCLTTYRIADLKAKCQAIAVMPSKPVLPISVNDTFYLIKEPPELLHEIHQLVSGCLVVDVDALCGGC